MQWSSLREDRLINNSLKFQHDQKLFQDVNSGHHLFSNVFWIQIEDSVFVAKNLPLHQFSALQKEASVTELILHL